MNTDIRYGRKRNGIKRALTKKLDEWIGTIDDVDVSALAAKNTIVTGGSIASMLQGLPINDYDVYFRDKETAIKVAEYYARKFNKTIKLDTDEGVSDYQPEVRTERIANIKGEEEDRVIIYLKSAGVAAEDQDLYKYFETVNDKSEMEEFVESTLEDKADDREPYRPIFLSQNAITLSNQVQIIIRFYGEPDKIHANYDFEHACCYWDHGKKELVLPQEALECLLSWTLIYKGSLYPIASIFRMKKFIERGWRITAGQQLKIMWQISEINLSDPETLREQLTGVDMAYMYELIDALSKSDPEKINSAYVATIIDRIFE